MSSEKILYTCKGTISNKYTGVRRFETKIEIDITNKCVSENGTPFIKVGHIDNSVCRWNFMNEFINFDPVKSIIKILKQRRIDRQSLEFTGSTIL
jgi:hypothetical protein